MNKLKNSKSKYKIQSVTKLFLDFVKTQQFSGIFLLVCTAFSIIMSNTELGVGYVDFWHNSLELSFYQTTYSGSIEFLINDGLMSVFFLLVGIEIKRELINGELSTRQKASLPLAAAFGGMIVPALIYALFNQGTMAHAGWGIPMATDIAFALGILALVGSKVPTSLKVFLTALAVVDDLGAIIVIGIFYSAGIQWLYAGISLLIIVILLLLNRFKVNYSFIYMFLGLGLWYCIHHMGVHATLAGVILAFTMPSHNDGQRDSMLSRLQHSLHVPVNFLIMPLFALANTCIAFHGSPFEGAPNTLMLGIIFGLFVGKPIGIILFSWIAVKLKAAEKPRGVSWNELIGTACLGGIGFTMSIFITILAFDVPEMINAAKITIVIASVMSGFLGFFWLKRTLK